MWRQLKSAGAVPNGRSSNSLAVVNHKVYIFSGENVPRVPVDGDLHHYDIDKQVWGTVSTKGTPPCPRVAHFTVALGSNIYLFGGRTGIAMGEGSLNDMYKFNTDTSEWEKLDTTGDIPPPRSYHSMVTVGDTIYLFGGCGEEGRLNDLHSFDTTSRTWKKLPSYDAIEPRGGPGFAVLGNFIYVYAGFIGTESQDMFRFNLETSQWETVDPSPNFEPRSVFSTAVVGGKIVVFGGELSPAAEGHAGAGSYTNETYTYDAGKNGWERVDAKSPPTVRGWFSGAAVSDTEMVIFGGNSPENIRRNDIHLLAF